jgi:oligoribonuclease
VQGEAEYYFQTQSDAWSFEETGNSGMLVFARSFSSKRTRMTAKQNSNNLVWLDLETEIATIITDGSLNMLAQGPNLVVHQPESVLSKMDEWCAEQHGNSGLIEEVRRSSVSLAQAEQETLEVVRIYCPEQGCPLCGNSICFDRRFLIRFMPQLNEYLSYRNVDVSTLKELISRWYPGKEVKGGKSSKHRTLSDIRESIEELKYYRMTVFSQYNG